MEEQNSEIIIPQEVNEIIDAASGDDESIGVTFTNNSVCISYRDWETKK